MLGLRELLEISERRNYQRVMTAIERAKAIGTYNQVDRSKQYQAASHAELVEQVNEAWSKIRRCEHALKDRDKQIEVLIDKVRVYKLKYTAVVAVITGLAWEGLKVLIPMLLHYLGAS